MFGSSANHLVGAFDGTLVRYDRAGTLIASRHVDRTERATYVGVDDDGRVLVRWGETAVHYTETLEPDWEARASAAGIGPGGEVAIIAGYVELHEPTGGTRWSQAVPLTGDEQLERWDLRVSPSGDLLVTSTNGVVRLAADNGSTLALSGLPATDHVKRVGRTLVTTASDDMILVTYDSSFQEHVRRLGRDGAEQWTVLLDAEVRAAALGAQPDGDVLVVLDTLGAEPHAQISTIARDLRLAATSGARAGERDRCASWPTDEAGALVAMDDDGFIVLSRVGVESWRLERYPLP